MPIHPTTMTKWRNRPGKSGSLKKVTVDTTVQEKNIAFPTDSKLLNKARENLVKLSSSLTGRRSIENLNAKEWQNSCFGKNTHTTIPKPLLQLSTVLHAVPAMAKETETLHASAS